MTIPDSVRDAVRAVIWAAAEKLQWLTLSASAKSKQYEAWTRDANVGDVLAHYINLADVRVYLKDTILKDYARAKQSDSTTAYRILGLQSNPQILKTYVKPHARQLGDGRLVCWGSAANWKAILMSAYERAHESPGVRPYAVLLMHAVGRYKQDSVRAMVQNAATRLGIEQLHWTDA